jgi:hypothetical protein
MLTRALVGLHWVCSSSCRLPACIWVCGTDGGVDVSRWVEPRPGRALPRPRGPARASPDLAPVFDAVRFVSAMLSVARSQASDEGVQGAGQSRAHEGDPADETQRAMSCGAAGWHRTPHVPRPSQLPTRRVRDGDWEFRGPLGVQSGGQQSLVQGCVGDSVGFVGRLCPAFLNKRSK